MEADSRRSPPSGQQSLDLQAMEAGGGPSPRSERPDLRVMADQREDSGQGNPESVLDVIVGMNSIFTLAVFIGLSWNPLDPANSLADGNCATGKEIGKNLISFEILSCGLFIFSGVVALSMKLAIVLRRWQRREEMSSLLLQAVIWVTAVATVIGFVFLMISIVYVVEIKLGKFSCSHATRMVVVPVAMLMIIAIFIFVSVIWYSLADGPCSGPCFTG